MTMTPVEQIRQRKASIARRRKRKRTRKTNCVIQIEEAGKAAEVIERTEGLVTNDEEVEARQLITELARSFAATIRDRYEYYGVTFEDVEKANSAALAKKDNQEYAEYRRQRVLEKPLHEVDWRDITALGEHDMQEAISLWWKIRNWATDELESGRRTGVMFGMESPQERARFHAIRDGFIEAWQPQNQIELCMVDMLTQTYSLYLYWSHLSHNRAITTQLRVDKENSKRSGKAWETPYQREADAIDQANKLADGYNRQFLRTLRQMRDLRRYAPPVIVNNGGQVNVATEGGQQVNSLR